MKIADAGESRRLVWEWRQQTLLYTRDPEVSKKRAITRYPLQWDWSRFSWNIQRSTSLLIWDLNHTNSLPLTLLGLLAKIDDPWSSDRISEGIRPYASAGGFWKNLPSNIFQMPKIFSKCPKYFPNGQKPFPKISKWSETFSKIWQTIFLLIGTARFSNRDEIVTIYFRKHSGCSQMKL